MKLLKVVASNFKLCEDNFTISFVPTANKTKDDKEFELNEIADNLYVYTTLGIIGKNASGKTMSAELLSVIYDILTNYRIVSSKRILKFVDKDISLDILFFYDGYIYRYLTKLCKDNISVDDRILFKEQQIFRREYKKSHAKNLCEFDKFEEVNVDIELPEDTSIIYYVSKKFNPAGMYYTSDDASYMDYSNVFKVYKLLDTNLTLIESILKMFDEHILDIKMINDNKFKIYYSDGKSNELSNDELYEILSSGTTKGFNLFSGVVFSLINGCDLIIDEIENHFHKTLVQYLVNLYKDKSVNRKNATLIFTTHYCELLDLFSRNDNIYISKFDKNIKLENMYEVYKFRPELSKSNKFYENAFNTNVNYESLMNFKIGLMSCQKK